ncbi:sigma 54-interacting transcriptional regulator [Fictibacillus sp. B-59209]
MIYHLQAKLLRVLQQKELVRVGRTEVILLMYV